MLVGIPAFAVRAPISPSNMVWAEKTISGTYYGSVRPDVDFPILADLDMDKKLNLERPDQPHLQIRRDKRGFSPAGVRLGSARPNRVRLMGRGPYGKTKMQVFVTGASWAPDKGITVVDRKTLDVVGTIQPSGILGPGHIATDSKGNIYLAQTTAGMQKLVFKGMPPTQ